MPFMNDLDPEIMTRMLEKWIRVSTPSVQHRALEVFIGYWVLTTRLWLEGESVPPTESEGAAEVRSILGGRFLLEELKSETLKPDAQGNMHKTKFEGLGLTGFDNFRNQYVTVWIDNMNTHLLVLSGSLDASGEAYTFYGQMDEPMLDVYGRTVKHVIRINNNDCHVLEIYDLLSGNGEKVVEIIYQRKK